MEQERPPWISVFHEHFRQYACICHIHMAWPHNLSGVNRKPCFLAAMRAMAAPAMQAALEPDPNRHADLRRMPRFNLRYRSAQQLCIRNRLDSHAL
jgi:hypothetical protein